MTLFESSITGFLAIITVIEFIRLCLSLKSRYKNSKCKRRF